MFRVKNAFFSGGTIFFNHNIDPRISGGHVCWNYHLASRDFNSLMLKLCTDFADAHDESKFALCDTVLRSFPKSSYGGDDVDAQAWYVYADFRSGVTGLGELSRVCQIIIIMGNYFGF
jgi:hypothetical protein